MKKTLMLSAMALLVAGGVAGCANCSKCCGEDCDDVVLVEAVEVAECPMCSQKHKCKTSHRHNEKCKDVKKCTPTASCKDNECKDEKKTETSGTLAQNCPSASESDPARTGNSGTEK